MTNDLSESSPHVKSKKTIVGIDLGTTNSVVAAVINGKPQVFPVDHQFAMPSIVGLSPAGSLLTGIVARNQLAAFPDKTVASIKRKMGTDEIVSLGEQTFTPVEISAMILRRLREVASHALGCEVDRAVITVPAYFDEHQRQATRHAGELAGLHVERIINEPTAATLVYHVDKRDPKLIAVYDFGGGTFDVSVVRMEEGVTEVLASQGDTKLGGDDIDHLLLNFVADAFQKQHQVDLRHDLPAKFRLLQACEQAKIRLSEIETVDIAEEFIWEKDGQPLHLKMSISRHQMEELIEPLIERTITCFGKALRDAKVAVHQIDDLVLVGGSTRIPMVADRLRDQFKLQPSRCVDPDLAVALGAAVQAAMLQGENVGPVLVDVSTHTLGIEAVVEMSFSGPNLAFVPIIHRGSPLPARYQESFAKMFSEQEQVEVNIYQGEHRELDRNTLIGTFAIDVSGEEETDRKIVVGFDLTLDGVLKITAVHSASGRTEELVLNNALTQLSAIEREAAASRLSALFDDSDQLTDLSDLQSATVAGRVLDGQPMDGSIDIEFDELPCSEFHDDQRLDAGHAGTPQPTAQLLEKARERFPQTVTLLERADEIKKKMQGEDADDLDSLRTRLYDALADDDADTIEILTADLDDLLFYVQ